MGLEEAPTLAVGDYGQGRDRSDQGAVTTGLRDVSLADIATIPLGFENCNNLAIAEWISNSVFPKSAIKFLDAR